MASRLQLGSFVSLDHRLWQPSRFWAFIYELLVAGQESECMFVFTCAVVVLFQGNVILCQVARVLHSCGMIISKYM